MSQRQEMHNSVSVEIVNPTYFCNFLKYNKINSSIITSDIHQLPVRGVFKVEGFEKYNSLIDVNCVFSSNPGFSPVDRTGHIKNPIKWSNRTPWNIPTQQLTLSQAMEGRVKELSGIGKKINVFWSGGIDSTSIVTAFLKFLSDRSQLRIIYSPWSQYEHPEYIDFLKKFPEVELIDQSGERYLDLNLDGIFITGNGGDEIHASVDESFLTTYGESFLQTSWRDFFYQKNPSTNFIEFCEEYFSLSGMDIQTVLEARWWFYTSCKIDSIHREYVVPYLVSDKTNSVPVRDIYMFFNCHEYEQFIYWNIHLIVPNGYNSWKQFLKDFCYEFDHLENWWRVKTKFHSRQLLDYLEKKIILNDCRYIAILDNNNIVHTSNLPFLSELEYLNKYGTDLKYLFNDPD